jgi:hypothetical protein
MFPVVTKNIFLAVFLLSVRMSEALRVHIQSPGTLEFPKANNLQVSEPDADKDASLSGRPPLWIANAEQRLTCLTYTS